MTTTEPTAFVPTVPVDNLPGVYLHHNLGGYLAHRSRTKGGLGPGHMKESSDDTDADEFVMIPLKAVSSSEEPPSLVETFDSSSSDDEKPVPLGSSLSSQDYEQAMLQSTHVAIAHRTDGTLRYISCRQKIPMMKRSMAEYGVLPRSLPNINGLICAR